MGGEMNNFSRIAAASLLLAGLGAGTPTLAQDKVQPKLDSSRAAPKLDSLFENFQRNAKSATFETASGERVMMMKYSDMMSLGTSVEGIIASVMYTPLLDEFIAFLLHPKDLSKMIIITGKGGVVSYYSGVDSLKAEEVYATAICVGVVRLAQAAKEGKVIELNISEDDVAQILEIFATEAKACVPIIKRLEEQNKNVQPQKFNGPKKMPEGESPR
jgi:hypothetical protein